MYLKLGIFSFYFVKIVLSYDDGPSSYTDEIVGTLRQNNIRAIFFPIFCNDEQRYQKIDELVSSGMVLGNHTFCHTELRKAENPKKINFEVTKQHELLSVMQKNISFFRFPSGIFNPSVIKILKKLGYTYILFWDVATKKSTTIQSVTNNIFQVANKKNTIIVLIHDIFPNSITITKHIVENFHFHLYIQKNKVYFFVVAPPEFIQNGGCYDDICIRIDRNN